MLFFNKSRPLFSTSHSKRVYIKTHVDNTTTDFGDVVYKDIEDDAKYSVKPIGEVITDDEGMVSGYLITA